MDGEILKEVEIVQRSEKPLQQVLKFDEFDSIGVRYVRTRRYRAVRIIGKTSKNKSTKLILRRNWGTETFIRNWYWTRETLITIKTK